MLKKIWYLLLHIFNIFIILATFVLAFIAIFNPDLVKEIIEWFEIVIQDLGNWNYFIAFLSAGLESFPLVGMLLPGQTILLLVWGFFGQEYLLNVMFLAALWAVVWNYTWYLLGFFVWDVFFKKYWYWFWIWETELEYIKKWIHKYWPIAIIISKFHPMTRAFVPFIAGSMWMKQFSFMLYNFIWSFIWAITVVWLWVLFVAYYEAIIDYLPIVILWLLFLWFLYLYFFKREKLNEYMIKKQEEVDRKYWK